MRFANLVVANSCAGLEAWRIGPKKGRVVHNAFDSGRLCATRSEDTLTSATAERFTVVMTSRMAPPKDFLTVIRAARILTSGYSSDWRFVLVGAGVDRPRLLSEASDLVAAGVVEFPLADLDVMDHVRRAHVGVLMSDPSVLAEGCPNSIMEYMACGLPVVCADSGGCRELVRDGDNGYVIPPRDAAALAGRLALLRRHPEVRARFGSVGKARVEQEFTVSGMVAHYVRLYEEVLAGPCDRART